MSRADEQESRLRSAETELASLRSQMLALASDLDKEKVIARTHAKWLGVIGLLIVGFLGYSDFVLVPREAREQANKLVTSTLAQVVPAQVAEALPAFVASAVPVAVDKSLPGAINAALADRVPSAVSTAVSESVPDAVRQAISQTVGDQLMSEIDAARARVVANAEDSERKRLQIQEVYDALGERLALDKVPSMLQEIQELQQVVALGQFDRITCASLEVVVDGVPTVSLGRVDGGGRVSVYSPNQRIGLSLSATAAGGHCETFSPTGSKATTIGPAVSGNGWAWFYGPEGKQLAQIGVETTGGAIRIKNASDVSTIAIGADSAGCGYALVSGADGTVNVDLRGGPAGGAAFVLNSEGSRVVTLGVADGNGGLWLQNADGELRFGK